METYQFWVMLAAVVSMITGFFGMIVAWLKGVDKRVSELEIKNAVLEAIVKERGKS